MTFDAFSSSKRVNTRNGLARALCVFGGALLWMALVPFGDEASAACPAWPAADADADAKTVTCTDAEYTDGEGALLFSNLEADGTLSLTGPFTVQALDGENSVVEVVANIDTIRDDPAALPTPRSPSLTVKVGEGVTLETSPTAGSQTNILHVVSFGGNIRVEVHGKIVSTEAVLPPSAPRTAVYLESLDTDPSDIGEGDISLTVGGKSKITAVTRTAISLLQERVNGGINVEIEDGAEITTGSDAG